MDKLNALQAVGAFIRYPSPQVNVRIPVLVGCVLTINAIQHTSRTTRSH